MRLQRLILGRYGHLNDIKIAFPDAPDLHVVLGANEAGKSTALAAIGDCLFRFPHKTNYDFLHATRDLRIGVTLQAADRRQETFFRRKGRKDDLVDEHDRSMPESAIAAFLGGATRERFDKVFGLNGAELRQGGDAILKGRGEIGEAILGAHTGLHGFRDLVARLDADARKLFGDRHGQKAFHVAAARYQQARQDRDRRRIDPAAWKEVEESLAALDQTLTDNRLLTLGLTSERSRLNRIRATTPGRLKLTHLLTERRALGDVPDLPPDAAERHRDAVVRREQAARDLDREQGHLAGLDAELEAQPEHATMLTVAAVIDDLVQRIRSVADALRDRAAQTLIAEQKAAAILADGRQLGLSLDPEALADVIPTALDREAVSQALGRQQHLSGSKDSHGQSFAKAAAKLADARAALAAMPAIESADDLRAAIEAVKAEGRLDTQRGEAENAADDAAATLKRALASLPFWDRDAAALAAAAVPLDADVQRLTEELRQQAEEVGRLDTCLAEHERSLTQLAAQAMADAAAGELPTAEAIAAVRDRRDAAWALIRRAYLDGGAALSAAERMTLTDDPGGAFAALIQVADRLVDRRAHEQERVVAAAQRQAEQVRRQALRDADLQLRLVAASRLDSAQAAWRALWRPCGVDPAEPPAMREWMQKRVAVLTDHKRLLDAERQLHGLRQRHADAYGCLSALLPAEAEAAGGALDVLRRSADRVCKMREAHAASVAKARHAVEAATADHAEAERAVARVDQELEAWGNAWSAAARSLSLPADAPVEVGNAALTLWSAIDQFDRERRDAINRVAQMTMAIDNFRNDAARVVAQVAPELAGAPDLAGTDALAAATALSQRLTIARQLAENRRLLTEQAAAARMAIGTSKQQHQGTQDALDRLRQQAGAADEDALHETLARWSKHRDISATIAEREAELLTLDDGKTLAELQAEAEGADFDTLPARIGEIDAELDRITKAELASQETMLHLRQQQEEMQRGHDAAAAAQDMETALADIDDIAARYVPLRIAHTLLRGGIERFRRQQQGPLLLRAGQMFARLTEGRYDRLEADENDRGEIFVLARQTDGTACPAERLSEGTLDQLYLALRLAAIETDMTGGEALPFIGDDLLVNFDNRRALAALRVLADFSRRTQVILFTHHDHIADLARGLATVRRFDQPVLAA